MQVAEEVLLNYVRRLKTHPGERAKMAYWCANMKGGRKRKVNSIMLIRELINEIATAGATSAGNIATVAVSRLNSNQKTWKIRKSQAPKKEKIPDGTTKKRPRH